MTGRGKGGAAGGLRQKAAGTLPVCIPTLERRDEDKWSVGTRLISQIIRKSQSCFRRIGEWVKPASLPSFLRRQESYADFNMP